MYGRSCTASANGLQARSRTASTKDWAHSLELLLPRDGRRGLRCTQRPPDPGADWKVGQPLVALMLIECAFSETGGQPEPGQNPKLHGGHGISWAAVGR